MTTEAPLYVKRVTIRDFKGAYDIEFVPTDYVVVIAGENGEGKSSALDALWAALQWSAASKDIPDVISNGADEAYVQVDLEEYVVTRVWTTDGTTIEVRDRNGKILKGTKKVLAGIVGKISLDPTAFGRLRDSEQRSALIRFVAHQLPFNIDELEAERASLFDLRTTAGQDARRLEGHFEELPEPPQDTPAKEVSVADLSAAHALAVKKRARAKELLDAVKATERVAIQQEGAVEAAKLHLEACYEDLHRAKAAAAKIPTGVDEMPSDGNLGNPAAIQAKIATAEELNADVRAAGAREAAKAEADAARAHYQELHQEIETLDAKKAAGLAAVEMPIEGLSFDDARVIFDPGEGSGPVPLRQASQAQRILAGIALSLSGKERLRAVRVTDGALLSKKTMEVLKEKARAGEFQLFIERADDRGAECYVIEDGRVVEEPRNEDERVVSA